MMAAAKEVGVNAAIAVVLSEPDYIFSYKEEQRTACKAFLYGKYVLVFPSVVLPRIMKVTNSSFIQLPPNLFF